VLVLVLVLVRPERGTSLPLFLLQVRPELSSPILILVIVIWVGSLRG
jgi:hypothetical protein